MHDLGRPARPPHMKCARVTGDVMGKYHPHGDRRIYDALVRMAQDFCCATRSSTATATSARPTIPPAAARYTECRLAALAMQMLDGIDEDTVDFVDNYAGEFQEPSVLPGPLPQPAGQRQPGHRRRHGHQHPAPQPGRGHRRHRPPIDNPEATPDDLMQFVKGPDFPTGGAHPRAGPGILDAYRTGRGSIRMRARAEIEEGKTRRRRSSSPSCPTRSSVGADRRPRSPSWSNARELDGIRDINDVSAGRRHPLVIELKRDANANVVLNNLFKHTPLQTSFAVNMVALVDGVPRTLNLAQALAGLRRPPGRGHHPALRVPPATRPRTGPTSSRACSRRST